MGTDTQAAALTRGAAPETAPLSPARYAAPAVAIHWIVAAAIIAMFVSAEMMTGGYYDRAKTFELYQWHKGLGVLVLLAVALRVVIRLSRSAPALPQFMPRWEVNAAKLGHLALYVGMIVMPLSGWLMVSSSPYGAPTLVFGLFEWPHVPGVAANKLINSAAKNIHAVTATMLFIAVAGHLLGTAKHAFIDKHNVLPRMWFATHRASMIAGVAVALAAVGVLAWPDTSAAPNVAATRAPAKSAPAAPGAYIIDYAQSAVTFSGNHAGTDFIGSFATWNGDILFDAENLTASTAQLSFDLASASTGSAFYDSTLPAADWFDVANHPTGRFISTAIKALETQGRYQMSGELTLRGIALPVTFDFTLQEDAGVTRVAAQMTVKRLDYAMGASSDPDASWVSNDIGIRINLVARKPESGSSR
ncbi:MAG: YceI family protein [Pseudomonadota bacterium]